MRFPRVKTEGQGFYHCISRTVHGLFVFRTSGRCSEAERILTRARRLAAFGGIKMLDYGVMGNHVHILCKVPEPRALSVEEMLERIEGYHGPQRAKGLRKKLARCAPEPYRKEQAEALLEPYRRRMNDISVFFKELKGGFAQDYNRRHQRYGAVWAERFKSILVEGGQALVSIAAYIDLNPVRAGLCKDPKDYRYCGYAEAVAKWSPEAFEGIRQILDLPEGTSCEELSREYRKYLFAKGAAATEKRAPAIEMAQAQRVIEEEKGEISLSERLRCKIRYFSDGVILGSRGFVEGHSQRLKEKLGLKRPRNPIALEFIGQGTLWVYRKNERGNTMEVGTDRIAGIPGHLES